MSLHKLRFQRRSGFALITVLVLVTILTILLGALIGTNRTAFQLLKVTQAQERMDRSIASVYAHCRERLEADYRWGQGPWKKDVTQWGGIKVVQTPGDDDLKVLTGIDSVNNCRFRVRFINNLKSDGEVAILKDMQEGKRRHEVPSGFCRFDIRVEANGQISGAEITARNPGLIGASLLANGELSIDCKDFDMLTKDPVKNQARSRRDTHLTGARNFLEGDNTPGSSVADSSSDNPIVWSGNSTDFRLNKSESYQAREPFKNAHRSLNFQDERFIDDARTEFDIPDVKLDELTDVKMANGDGKGAKHKIPSGQYRFEQYSMNGGLVRALTRRKTTSNSDLQHPDGPVDEYWWAFEPGETTTVAPTDSAVAANFHATSSQGTFYGLEDYATINPTGGGGARADLKNRRMVLDEEYNFQVDGDFSLIGHSPVNGDDDLRQVIPALYFGDPKKLEQTADFTVGGAVNTVTRSSEKGSLEAKNGRIHIQGDISGSATIAATGDVSIQPSRFFDDEGNSDVNFSVFSEGNVSLLPPPILETYDDRIIEDDVVKVVDQNGDRKHEGVGDINISENHLKFTGLIYARGEVLLDLQDTVSKQGSRRSLTVEGAVVSRGGNLTVKNADKLKIIYNPQFVDRFAPSLSNTSQRRIEVTGWKKTKPANFD